MTYAPSFRGVELSTVLASLQKHLKNREKSSRIIEKSNAR
jgi:hypothetical protein